MDIDILNINANIKCHSNYFIAKAEIRVLEMTENEESELGHESLRIRFLLTPEFSYEPVNTESAS